LLRDLDPSIVEFLRKKRVQTLQQQQQQQQNQQQQLAEAMSVDEVEEKTEAKPTDEVCLKSFC
jgi:hypothetical protein